MKEMRLFGSRGAPKAVVVKPAAQTTTKPASNSSTSSDSETRDEVRQDGSSIVIKRVKETDCCLQIIIEP